jgi:hypothetical protein
MSRNTITITTPLGAKVRTVRSKIYFVVREREQHVRVDEETGTLVRVIPPVLVAKVVKRTDSPSAAWAELRRHPYGTTVYRVVARQDGGTNIQALHRAEIAERADVEKADKAFAKRIASQGEARRLAY